MSEKSQIIIAIEAFFIIVAYLLIFTVVLWLVFKRIAINNRNKIIPIKKKQSIPPNVLRKEEKREKKEAQKICDSIQIDISI